MTITPPDQTVWWDTTATLASVLSTLRLQGGDIDEQRLEALIPAAGGMINDYRDAVEPLDVPAPATLQAVLERLVIDLYRGIVEDPVGWLAAQLLASKERFGVS